MLRAALRSGCEGAPASHVPAHLHPLHTTPHPAASCCSWQGRDDIGRPLLERALAIQEKHLGPDHPDVVAIRDVLSEEV